MESNFISDCDSLFRHTIFPIMFRNNGHFAAEKVIRFSQEDGSILASVAWDRYLPNTRQVQRSGFGCRLAVRMNERSQGRKSAIKLGLCGFISCQPACFGYVAHNRDEITVEAEHERETDVISTTKYRLNPFPRPNVESTKTAVIDRMWNGFSGPSNHKCDCDRDIQPHPNSELIPGPRGPYSRLRSRFRRYCCLVKFQLASLYRRLFPLESPH